MGNALQDQLLNIGLVDKKKAAQTKKDKYKKNKKNRQSKAPIVDENKLLVQQQMEQKKEQDRLLNLQKEELVKARAIKAQIKQLIEMNSLNEAKGDISFNFQDGQLVKRINVGEKIQQQLINGKVAISKWEDKYHIVPQVVAEKISQRDVEYIILLNDKIEEDDGIDDEYADYEIPDDLMW